MPAYAPTRHQASARPGTLALVVGVHVAVIAVALAAKFDAERGAPPIITARMPSKMYVVGSDQAKGCNHAGSVEIG